MAAQELKPLFGGSNILAKAEGELEPLNGYSATAAQFPWIAFVVNLGCTTGSSGYWSVRRPGRCWRQLLTAATQRAFGAEPKRDKNRARIGRTNESNDPPRGELRDSPNDESSYLCCKF